MTQLTLSPPDLRRPGLALTIIVAAQLMLTVDATVMNVALPRIRTELGFTPAGLSWVINAYTLVFGGLLLLGGRMGDLVGKRRTFLGGVAVFTAASLLGALADSATLLLVARMLQGLGAAAAGPSTIALITTTFTAPTARIRALAVFSGVTSAGFAVGLIIGGLLTEWLSWRAVLLINIPLGLAILALATRYLVEPARHPARLDLPGALVGTAGTGSLVYGLIQAAEQGWHAPTLVPLVAGVVLLAGFVVVEARTRQPLMPLRLFADRNRAAGYLSVLLGTMTLMPTFFFLTQYLQEVRGYGALDTGLAFLPLAASMFAMSRLVPRWLPTHGPRPITVTGALLMVAALAWLTRLTEHSEYVPGLLGPMILLGVGGGLAFTPLNVAIMSTVAPGDTGAAGGALQTMQQVGGTIGIAVLVTVAGAATGASAVDVTTSALTMSTVFAAATLLVTLSFRRPAAMP
ncbi:MFS transporter [Actinophytocola sediminis]